MKRKVIKQGSSTLTLSLPSKWTRRFGIKAGEEIEVVEQGQRLMVSTPRTAGQHRESLDLTGVQNIPRRILASYYIKGSDEVEICLASRDQAKRLQARIRTLQGFEIVEQTKDAMVVKDVTGAAPVDVDQLVRRIFHMVSTVGKESLQAFKARQTDLEYLEEMEGSINRFAELCYRSINKQGSETYAKITSLYSICWLLEAVADEIKEILAFIRENDVKLSPDTVKVYSLLLDLIRSFEDLYSRRSLEKADCMSRDYDALIAQIDAKLLKKQPKEVVVLMRCRSAAEYLIWAMNQRIVGT